MSKRFSCEYCAYMSTRLYNLERHVATKHIGAVAAVSEHGQNNNLNAQNHNPNAQNHNTKTQNHNISDLPYSCHSCYKTFTSSRTLQTHIRKGYCKHISSPFECEKCHTILSCQPSKSRHRKHCKGLTENTLTYPAPPMMINNIQTQNIDNRQIIVNVNNFGSENRSHITTEFIETCLHGLRRGVCDYIERVNFNPQVPENHTIRYQDSTSVRVKEKENTWRLRHMETVIHNLISMRCDELQTHYDSTDHIKNKDKAIHFNIIRDFLHHMRNGVKNEVKPIYEKVIILLKELEASYTK